MLTCNSYVTPKLMNETNRYCWVMELDIDVR